ncbi:MAG: DUF4838 domain-containing protein [Lentisphaeria bacterium]|nr:DUF4838 domain-containing protein [Lentisphaeria bacterium]
MKIILLLLCAAPLFLSAAADFRPKAHSVRQINIGKKPFHRLEGGNFEIVCRDSKCSVTRFAAEELAEFLGRTLKCKLKVLFRPTGKNAVIYVGSTDKSEVKKLDRDGFYIRSKGKDIEIAGHDEKGNPKVRSSAYAKGTLFGVYDFLERFAGVRFYFPGKYGVVVTPRKSLEVPELDIVDRPDMQFRSLYLNPDPPQMEGQKFIYEGITEREMRLYISLRSRADTMFLPNCHGLAYLGYVQRFGRSNPEYFALKANGSRFNTPDAMTHNANGQLCFSEPGLRENVYQDAVAVLTKQPASSRKIIMPNGKCYWAGMFRAPYFNIMPNDSLAPCHCKRCLPNLTKGDEKRSAFYWDFFIDTAERLQRNNIPGFVTTMAYHPYHLIPERKIPSNMIVMLALPGAWQEATPLQQAKNDERVKAWVKKLKAKTYLWTYANKQYMPWIPNFAPRAVGKYYARQAPYIFGTFFEGENDIWLYSYLNYYVLSRVLWDSRADVDAIVEEHYQKMFGPGAAEMKEFFDTLEKKWLHKVVGNIVETSLGPIVVRPPEYKLWQEIYSPTFMSRARQLFDTAAKKCAKAPDARERIEFFRRNYLANMEEGARRFAAKCDERDAWDAVIPEISSSEKPVIDGKVDEKAWKKSSPLWLVPRKNEKNEVKTLVYRCRDKENLYFAFVCEEPFTSAMATAPRKADDPKLWMDNTIEVLLDTAGKRNFHQQFIINSDGVVTDLVMKHNKADYKWNAPHRAKVSVIPGKQWSAEICIPLKGLAPMEKSDRIHANFTRIRILKNRNAKTVLYNWCRMIGGHRADEFGVLHFKDLGRKNLLSDGDFEKKTTRNDTRLGQWSNSEGLNRESTLYRTSGASLRFEGKRKGARQWFKGLKPGTEYELSFYVRMENVTAAGPRGGLYARINDSGKAAHYLPKIPLTGTMNWTRHVYRFKTSPKSVTTANTIDFNFYRANGRAWIDHVGIYEVKGKSQ